MSVQQSFSWKEVLPLLENALREELSADVAQNVITTLRRDPIASRLSGDQFTIDIPEDTIVVSFGPRDWSFDLDTGELIGAGTFLLR